MLHRIGANGAIQRVVQAQVRGVPKHQNHRPQLEEQVGQDQGQGR